MTILILHSNTKLPNYTENNLKIEAKTSREDSMLDFYGVRSKPNEVKTAIFHVCRFPVPKSEQKWGLVLGKGNRNLGGYEDSLTV